MRGAWRLMSMSVLAVALVPCAAAAQERTGLAETEDRPRARDVGVVIGSLPPGPGNAITDVEGVRVGHSTLVVGDSLRTGVTAILPHSGNLFREKVRAAIAVGNGFGKLVGATQVNELGEIETPVLLTGTLSVFRGADALIDTMLAIPENRGVRSINPVVGETNDGFLSDIRARPIRPEQVRAAVRDASPGPVEEGTVGAGTGTTALGWKGGIGTASRRLSGRGETVTLGVLVQTNFGGDLRIAGAPVGRELGTGIHASPPESDRRGEVEEGSGPGPGGGSVMIVVATDAPLAHRELQRLAFRTFLGVARTGSHMSHGSGDYAIAFSTSGEPPRRDGRLMSRLFEAAVEATEEAVVNSLFRATTVTGFRGHMAEAIPVDAAVEVVRRHGLLGGTGAEGGAP